MEAILTALSPFIVSYLTGKLKTAKEKYQISSEKKLRKIGIRVLVAALSLGSVVGTALISDNEIDVASISTFVDTLLVFLGASGAYLFTKKSGSTE